MSDKQPVEMASGIFGSRCPLGERGPRSENPYAFFRSLVLVLLSDIFAFYVIFGPAGNIDVRGLGGPGGTEDHPKRWWANRWSRGCAALC